MKSAREVAEETVPDAGLGTIETRSRAEGSALLWRTRIEDAEDYVPLEVQGSQDDAELVVEAARGIIERLVTREREPLVAVLREVAEDYRARIAARRLCDRNTQALDSRLAMIEAALKE